MKKVDFKEKARLLNDFIQKNQGKVMSTQEIKSALKELLTKNDSIIVKVLHSFPCEVMGSSKMYEIPKTPIYMGVIEKAYQAQRAATRKSMNKKKFGNKPVETPVDKFSEAKEENDAIRLLLSRGYKIQKPLGLDVKQLLKDHPEIEKVYMRYTTL